MQINLGQILEQSLGPQRSTEQRLGAELMKAYGLTGTGFENLSLMDIFGAPGHSAIGTSALRDVEQLRGWNFTAVVAKALEFSIGNMAVYCPEWMAQAICEKYGEEYKASKRVSGVEQYNIPEDWVVAPSRHVIAKLMRKPNPWLDQATFFFQLSLQSDIHGVANVLVLPNANGLPSQMWVIPKAAIQPLAPSAKYPEGSYRIGHLSKLSINTYDNNQEPRTMQEMLAKISNREYSAKYIIPVGMSSPLFLDDFLNPSSALSDVLDTDTVIHQSRRASLSKQMTNGPRLEPMPGVTIDNSEWVKIMEEFESQNQGPDKNGNAWKTPNGVKVTNDAKSGREMEFVDSANQSRDHMLGQRQMSAAMLGLGDGGSYAQVVGLIKGNARRVMQPLMRIYAGQLTLGLQRFFEAPQSDFMTVMQCANIDDPEQRMREWGFLKEAGAVKVGEVRNAFNMMPFEDEAANEKIAGSQEQPGGMNPFGGGSEYDEYGDETAQTDSGEPETPGIGAAEASPETMSSLKTSGVESRSVSSTMSRREFMRHSKNIMDIVTKFKDGVFGEKTARLMLQTLGLPTESAQEFIDSVKDPLAEQSMSTAQNQTTATALFSRMAAIKSGTFKSLVDDQAQTAATHPGNDLKQPTEKEAKAGLYRKGKVRLCGMQIDIENPVGSIRSGRRPDGSRWAVEMQDHYGYVVGAVGFDKDQLDIFIKQGCEPTFDGSVYVINQANADGSFDEHKCFIGCESKLDAIKRYLDNYDDDWSDRIMSVAELTIPQFKDWMLDADGGPLTGELTPDDSLKYVTRSVVVAAEPMSVQSVLGGAFENEMAKTSNTQSTSSYGYCPICGAETESRERKFDGNDTCFNGHIYPSKSSLKSKPVLKASSGGLFKAITETELRNIPNELEQDNDDPQVKAELIADILTSLYGDEAEALISDGDDAEKLASAFGKAFGSAGMFKEARTVRRGANSAGRDPRDADGDGRIFDGTPQERAAGVRPQEQPARRSRARNTPERIAEIHSQVESALKGERTPKSAKALADSLSSLTVKQLHELKTKYQMKASGRTKTELIAKLAKRLDAGRRKDQSVNPVAELPSRSREIVPQKQPKPAAALAAAQKPKANAVGPLNGSIVDSEDAGWSDEKIVQSAIDSGWSSREMYGKLKEATWSNEQIAAALENTGMQDHKVMSFLNDVGLNDNEIYSAVDRNGWSNQRIEKACDDAGFAPSQTEAILTGEPRENFAMMDEIMSRTSRTKPAIVEKPPQVKQPEQQAERQQPAQAQSPEVQQRLDALRANLPGKFVIAQDESRNSLLVTPNDRTRKLSSDPAEQVTQIEDQLRRRGFNPDDIVAGGSKPQRKDKPAPVEKPVQNTQEADSSEDSAPRRSRRLNAAQKAALEKIGCDFLDDLKPDADGDLIMAQKPSKGRVLFTEGTTPQSWGEVPLRTKTQVQKAIMEEKIAELKSDAGFKASLRASAMAEAVSAVQSTMPDASNDDKAVAVIEQTRKMMSGRSSWMNKKLKSEAQVRINAMSDSDKYSYANRKEYLSSMSAPQTQTVMQRFGLKEQDLASIIGLPDDWVVKVTGYGSSLYLEVDNSTARMNRYVTMNNGKLHVENAYFRLDKNAPKGLGLGIFSKAIANAKRLGVPVIDTHPCRSSGEDGMVGYAVWPQFGYDAPLTNIESGDVIRRTRAEFPNAQTIRDVFDTPGGQDWWWANGTSISNAKFFTDDDSRNMNALQSYMAKKKAARDKIKAGVK